MATSELKPQPVFGRFPLVAAATAIGLVICSVTDALSRATLAPSLWLFWAGVAIIVAPIVYRLCSADASTWERVALVCLLGLSLYVVKLMRDPFGYTIPDEFFHAFNADQIASHHVLFGADSVLPITTRYPGLEGATSALSSMTGMSSFGAGIILIGAARLTLMLGLFVLFSAVSGSWRVAGLGAAIYAGNGNFLLWSAQFSYESLALPLLVVVLAAIATRAEGTRLQGRAWVVPIVLGIAAIVITHHLTSYLLDVVLLALAAAPLLARRRSTVLKVWPFALFSFVLTAAWLVVVASTTVGYLSPVVSSALRQTLHTIVGETAPRAPFHPGPGSVGAPIADRIVAFAALGILAVALPFGLVSAWRRRKGDPIAVGFCLAAIGFFGVLGLRFAPSAWEIGNRTGEFLFIGLGFAVACGSVDRLLSRRRSWPASAFVAMCAAVVVVGGAIIGWPANGILAAPVRVAIDGRQVESETIAVARWVGVSLPGASFVAPESAARTILLYGHARVLIGTTADIGGILSRPIPARGELPMLRRNAVRYVVVDSRRRAADSTTGYAFSVHPPGGATDRLTSTSVAANFDGLPVPRVFDSGDIAIYDLRRVP